MDFFICIFTSFWFHNLFHLLWLHPGLRDMARVHLFYSVLQGLVGPAPTNVLPCSRTPTVPLLSSGVLLALPHSTKWILKLLVQKSSPQNFWNFNWNYFNFLDDFWREFTFFFYTHEYSAPETHILLSFLKIAIYVLGWSDIAFFC